MLQWIALLHARIRRRDGVIKKAIMEGDNEVVPLRDRIIGRYSSEDTDPSNPTERMISAGSLITEEIAANLDAVESPEFGFHFPAELKTTYCI